MICHHCQHDADQVVHCDCFETLCRVCFADHHCGHEHLARFSGARDPAVISDQNDRPIEPVHSPAELSAAIFNLRPYQQDCVAKILEALA